MLRSEGWHACTVRAICAGARLTPRYFYESFANRDELLLALFDEVAQESAAVVLAAVAEQASVFYHVPESSDPLVETSALMLAGGLAETLLAWLGGTLRVTSEQLIEDCADLFVATAEAAVRLVRLRTERANR